MPMAEAGANEEDFLNPVLEDLMAEGSTALYYILVLLCRNEPLNIVINSGSGEGLVSWRRLVQRYDSAAAKDWLDCFSS